MHNTCNVLESSQNHPPTPCPWKNCLTRNRSLVPKRLGTAALEPFKNYFFVPYSPVDTRSSAFRASRARCFGGLSLRWKSHKLSSPNPSLLKEKLGVEFLAVECCHNEGGVYGDIVSPSLLPILIWLFSFTGHVGVTQLVSGFVSEGVVPYVA